MLFRRLRAFGLMIVLAAFLPGCASFTVSEGELTSRDLSSLAIRAPLPLSEESTFDSTAAYLGGMDISFDDNPHRFDEPLKAAMQGSGVFEFDAQSPYRLVVTTIESDDDGPFIGPSIVGQIFGAFIPPIVIYRPLSTTVEVWKADERVQTYVYETKNWEVYSLFPTAWLFGRTKEGFMREYSALLTTNLIHDMAQDGLL